VGVEDLRCVRTEANRQHSSSKIIEEGFGKVTVLVSISDLIISRGELNDIRTPIHAQQSQFHHKKLRISTLWARHERDQQDLFSLLLCEQFEDNSQEFVDNPIKRYFRQLLLPDRPSMRRRIIGSSSPEKPVAGIFFTLKIVIFNSCVPMTSDKPEKINSVPSSSKGICESFPH
jgi:hypothetical protein